mgnify:CR=1 FL=1
MVVTLLTALLVAIIAAVFRAEFEAWMPWIAERLRRHALKPLTGELRERLDEEWNAYLADTPGYVGKVWQAIGFNWASRRVAISLYRRRVLSAGIIRLMSVMFKGAGIVSTMSRRMNSIAGNPVTKFASRLLSSLSVRMTSYALITNYWRIGLIGDAARRQAAHDEYTASLTRFIDHLRESCARADRGEPLEPFEVILSRDDDIA